MKKTWLLILISSILVLEAVMRFCYGAPPRESDPAQFKYQYVDIYKKFFKKIRRGNERLYISQKSEGIEFSDIKPPDTVRIFIIGGSVAGFFNPSFLSPSLRDVNPEKKFEIINCGMGAYDSYRDYLVAKEILAYKPDFIIVLSGNNEFYDKVKVNLYAYYINKFFRRAWLYRQLQNRILQWHNGRGPAPLRNREQRLRDFRKNIRHIVHSAKAKGIPVILCTLPVNFKDCPPGGIRPLDKQFLWAQFLLERGNYSKAIEEFKKFLKDNPSNDFGWYFLGCAYEAIEDYSKAKECYAKALEVTQCFDRATPDINKIIRQVCYQEKVGLADLEMAFIEKAPHGLLGREQFYDKCHFYSEFYSLVANTVINEIFQNYTNIINPEKNKIYPDLFSYNFPSLEERGRDRSYIDATIAISFVEVFNKKDKLSERAISFLKTLYFINPDALWRIKLSKNELKEIIFKNLWTSALISDSNFNMLWPYLLFHIGEMYRRLGLYEQSLEYFSEVIYLDGGYYLPYLGRALTYDALGDKQKSKEDIYKAAEKSSSMEVKYYKDILFKD